MAPRRSIADASDASCRLAPAPQAATHARAWVRPLLATWALDGLGPDVTVVLGELVTNAVRHGQGEVRLRVSRTRDGVRVEVADSGSARVLMQEQRDPPAPSGRGLVLVDRLSSSWGVDYGADGGKVVWAELVTDAEVSAESAAEGSGAPL